MFGRSLTVRLIGAVTVIITAVCGQAAEDAESNNTRSPNVVMIMTDNHGAWTLGCYGNQDIRTPNINRLAAEGTLFDNAFASNPVCSPTRATVLTGLLPSQHGVHCFLRGGRLQTGPEARCTLDEFTSLPEVLKSAGYSCGLVGEWHLGGNMQPQEGLDDYWITMPHGGTSTFYDAQIIEQGRLRTEPEYLTDFWTRHAVNYINQQAEKKDQPFFLFLAYNGPYALSRLLLREGQNRHAEFYRDQPLLSFPRETPHPWQLHNLDYQNNPVSISRVATEVSGVDDGVGTVLATLQQRGLDQNTIVIFLADQGWVGGHGGFFGMGDHTRPVTARDGMMKIPMIWRQPDQIAAGHRSKKLVANYDVMPTLLELLELEDKMPRQPASPGTSFASEFVDEPDTAGVAGKSVEKSAGRTPTDDAVYYEFEGLRCIRTDQWKYVHRHPNGPDELYHLKTDPEEFENLVDDAQYATTRTELKQRLDAFFAEYASPKYDLYNGGGSQTVIYDGVEEEIAQEEPVAPPELPAGFKPQQFTLPDGFSAELVAGPPLVNHPTMGCFDDQGRLFICDGAGVNMSAEELEKNLPNRINLLEDQDGDGHFDRSTVFADKMTFPMGGVWHDGALYVASPPNIWRLEDTTGDGVADRRDIIVDKFGYTGNAASIHGCFFSPDGRLYWCDGYHGHEFTDADGNVVSQRKGSYIFSSRPDGSDIRIHCGGGMDNPVEVDFTEEGDVIGTVNILYTRPRIDCLVHWQYGGAYPHREAVLDELQITGELLGPIHHFGHVAISGTTRYRSGVMNHNWRDNYFATEFNLGKVVRVELERSGSTYTCTERQFLSCNNRDFHPTDIMEDADGSLLVVDTGGWFYRGCPTSQVSRPDVLGGIYRIRRDHMTTVPDPRGERIDWAVRTGAQLMQDLKDTRFVVREKAIHECVRRRESIIDRLAATAKNADILARRGALWALTRIVSGELPDQAAGRSRSAIRAALNDRDAGIRQVACHSLTVTPDADSVTELIGRLQDRDSAVRRKAAEALGRAADRRAIPALVKTLAEADRELVHAATYALIEIGGSEDLRKATAGQTDPAILIRAAMAVLQSSDQPPAADGTLVCDWPEAPVLQRELLGYYRELLKNLNRRKADSDDQLSAEISQLFAAVLAADRQQTIASDVLSDFVADFARVESVANRVGQLLADAATSSEQKTAILAGIARSGVPLHDSWTSPLIDDLTSDNPEQVAQAVASVATIRSPRFAPQLAAIAGSDQQTALLRLAAMEALLAFDRKLSTQSLATLMTLVRDGSPAESVQAARVLGSAALTEPQLEQVTGLLPLTGPQQLLDIVPLFRRTRSVPLATAFLNSLEGARSLNSLPMIEVSEVVKSFPQELHERSNALLDQMKTIEQEKLLKLDSLIGQLKAGDAARGREVFFSEKAKCATCHVVGRQDSGELLGKRVGPDLTTIGANRAPQDLLESIIFPSATIVRQYEPYTLVNTEGRTWSGLVIKDTSEVVTIQQSTGDPVTVKREDIEELVPATVSIMPKGLDETLTAGQIADLMAWLQTLR
ncbi:MAG: sulfatase-like hydrolase/transferase [Fuerstiella sp.]